MIALEHMLICVALSVRGLWSTGNHLAVCHRCIDALCKGDVICPMCNAKSTSYTLCEIEVEGEVDGTPIFCIDSVMQVHL